MKLASIISETEFRRVSELTPTPTGAAPGATTMAPNQQVQQDPAAQARMMAQQALDRANRKKQIQDQIKQTQEQLAALQKELATIK